jgi:hypothetical protein
MRQISFASKNVNYSFLILCFALLFGLSACQEEQIVEVIGEDDTEMIELETEVEATFEDVDEFSIEAVEITDLSSMGRAYNAATEQFIPGCATVTHDSANKIITIDFGTGCVGQDGKTRAGQIIVTYTKRLYRPGAKLKIELNNYFVDNKQIEGTKRIENLATSFQDNISLKTTLQSGKITWPDSSFATRQFTRTRTWIRAANPVMDEYHVEGMVQGTRKNGNNYSANIISTVIFKRKCRLQGIKVPVQGLKLIKRTGKPDLLVDFGDGDCDSLATLTMNGQSKVIDLSN